MHRLDERLRAAHGKKIIIRLLGDERHATTTLLDHDAETITIEGAHGQVWTYFRSALVCISIVGEDADTLKGV